MATKKKLVAKREFFDKNYWKDWTSSKNQTLALQNSSTISVVDLFCGCGGMTLGAAVAASFSGAGISIALAADNSKSAEKIYRKNFAEQIKKFFSGDITEIFPPNGLPEKSADLVDTYGEVNLLVAGPPCQGHSNLNNSTRRDDPRNQLYLSAITAIEALRPNVAIVENVPAVIHDKTGITKSSYLRLTAAGYFVEEIVLRVDMLGLPQRRKRHLMIARRMDVEPISQFLEDRQTAPGTLAEFIGDLRDEWKTSSSIFSTPSRMSPTNLGRAQILFDKNLYDLPDDDRPPCHRDKPHSYKSAYGRLKWDEPAQTITSGFGSMGQGRYIHPEEVRTITPHEAARIQGFPDFFDFDQIHERTRLQEVIANAVPPPAIATIVQGFLKNDAFNWSANGKEENN